MFHRFLKLRTVRWLGQTLLLIIMLGVTLACAEQGGQPRHSVGSESAGDNPLRTGQAAEFQEPESLPLENRRPDLLLVPGSLTYKEVEITKDGSVRANFSTIIANEGQALANATVVLTDNGVPIAETTSGLSPNTEREARFHDLLLAPGTHDLAATIGSGEAVGIQIDIPLPADLALVEDSISVEELEFHPSGQTTFAIAGTVINIGGRPAKFRAGLLDANGAVIAEAPDLTAGPSETQDIELEVRLLPGEHRLTLGADYYREVVELAETRVNNNRDIELFVPTAADPQIENVSVDFVPGGWNPDLTVTYDVNVELFNAGERSVSGLRLLNDADGMVSELIGDVDIEGGGLSTATFQVHIFPGERAGSLVLASADLALDIYEYSVSVPLRPPDLDISGASASLESIGSDNVALYKITIRGNRGHHTAAKPTEITMQIEGLDAAPLGDPDWRLGDRSTFTYTISGVRLEPGTHKLSFEVNPDRKIVETDYTNNTHASFALEVPEPITVEREVWEHFESLACTDDDGEERLIRGVREPIRIFVVGEPKQVFVEKLDASIDLLREDGFDVARVDTEKDANSLAYLAVDHREFFNIFPWVDVTFLETHAGFSDFRGKFAVARNRARGSSNYSDSFILSTIDHELAHEVTKLLHSTNRNSLMVSDGRYPPEYTDIDRAAFRLRNTAGVDAGMKCTQVNVKIID